MRIIFRRISIAFVLFSIASVAPLASHVVASSGTDDGAENPCACEHSDDEGKACERRTRRSRVAVAPEEIRHSPRVSLARRCRLVPTRDCSAEVFARSPFVRVNPPLLS